jgi:hypothetical protein
LLSIGGVSNSSNGLDDKVDTFEAWCGFDIGDGKLSVVAGSWTVGSR